MITVPVMNLDGKEVDTMTLEGKIFDGSVNEQVVYLAVKQFRAGQRKGLASTKTRGDVRGGGKKPWKQKGTGRARVGSIRSPLWRHGGVTFGPHPRDFSYHLPQRMKRLALVSALVSKINENKVLVVDRLEATQAKTKEMATALKNLKVNVGEHRVLVLVDSLTRELSRAMANLTRVDVMAAKDVNAYEILAAGTVIATKAGVADLVKRLKATGKK